MRKVKPLKTRTRICKYCNKYYKATSKRGAVCDKCRKKNFDLRVKRMIKENKRKARDIPKPRGSIYIPPK